jgi:hypothetical protein
LKKLFLMAALVAGTAFAGDYATVDYSVKDKQNSDQQNQVYGLNVGHKFDGGFALEGRMENEVVNTPKHEGLLQVKGTYDIATVAGITPYAALGTGYKSKSTTNFNFYVAEVGARTSIGPVGVKYAYRLRDAYQTGNDYRTKEHSITGGLALDKSNSIFVKYARERGDSDYNTWGIGLTHAF